ncbi:MAG: hypothetical protein AB7Q29_19890 [Vicinamibacterales bacterium]
MAKRNDIGSAQAPATRRVRLARPGVLACGPYGAGEVHEVEAAEAARLVEVKGFEYVEE